MLEDGDHLTSLLKASREGDEPAKERLLGLVYDENSRFAGGAYSPFL